MNFDIQNIQEHLATLEVGNAIRLFKEVTSTNDALRELAKAGAPEGTVVIADEQLALPGSRRRNRRW
jgi:BirA family biotin operon repressor/biotin-[acetyl-CoA-carboxylase] ligase